MTTMSKTILPPGFQKIGGNLMHVVRLPGLHPGGPSIALVHGIAAAGSTWLPLVRHLIRYAREIIYFDLPAHGLSPAPQLPFTCLACYQSACECLIQNLSPESNNLVIGNSLGGAFALKFALEHPEYVARNVLISPAGLPFPESASAVLRLFCGNSLSDANKVIDRIWVHPNLKARVLAPALRHVMRKPAFKSLLDSIMEIDTNPSCELSKMIMTPEMLKQYHTKSLLIWGGKDRVLPQTMRDEFDKCLPECVTRLFPSGYGHCPQFEEPTRLAVQILDWIENEALN